MLLAFATAGLFGLSILAGMFGVGVAFAAIPLLGLFLDDLVNQVQPLALLLNGATAAASAAGFAVAQAVPWRRALAMTAVTSAAAPLGTWDSVWKLARKACPAATAPPAAATRRFFPQPPPPAPSHRDNRCAPR